MKNAERERGDSEKSKLDIATVGSKNRICLPPKTCEHMEIEQGDYLAIFLDYTRRDGKPYARLVNVKSSNLTVDDGQRETIADVLRR